MWVGVHLHNFFFALPKHFPSPPKILCCILWDIFIIFGLDWVVHCVMECLPQSPTESFASFQDFMLHVVYPLNNKKNGSIFSRRCLHVCIAPGLYLIFNPPCIYRILVLCDPTSGAGPCDVKCTTLLHLYYIWHGNPVYYIWRESVV